MKKKDFITILSSEQKSKLKALAHHLKPLVKIGNQGFSDSVKKEIAQALDFHELIKVQLPPDTNAKTKEETQLELLSCLPTHAHMVSRIGRTLILYLEKDSAEKKISLK